MFKYFVIFLLINVTSVLLLPIDEKEPVADKPAEELVALKEPSTEAPIVISSSSSSESPVTPEHIPSPAIAVLAEGTSSRPTITFDQRQEGHYNIRADLENFVFLVVPTHSASSLNLLDLLSKSAYKKSHAKHAHKKHEIKGEGIKKIESAMSHHHHYRNSKPETDHGLEQFVEGRTPYKVDISSIDTSPETQLDVLPASPLSYPSQAGRSSTGPLKPIKFAFDDNTPIGSVIPIKGNFLRQYRSYPISNHYHIPASPLLVTVVDHKQDFLLDPINYSEPKTKTNYNSGGDDDNSNNNNFNSILLTASDSDNNNNDNNNDDDSFDSLINIDKMKLSPLDQRQQQFENGWDLKLLGATEQCGPDGYRDSYGVCQYFKLD